MEAIKNKNKYKALNKHEYNRYIDAKITSFSSSQKLIHNTETSFTGVTTYEVCEQKKVGTFDYSAAAAY